jgi:hypothetical protein
MLRTYTAIDHPIKTLHTMLQHLVCEVWCNASDVVCEDLLEDSFKELYNHLGWLKSDVDVIYEKCKTLTTLERENIVQAFETNNSIEELCNGTIAIVELNTLPNVIQVEVKSLLESFYSRLLDIKKVPGEKLDYYNQLVDANKYNTCPICGLADIETTESNYIEDYDHFFPKSHYPFLAVNFGNLVPTCDKCNKKHKGSKKPLDKNGKAYYPFEARNNPIDVSVNIDKIDFDKDEKLIDVPTVSFTGDTDKNTTWNWLFNIEERYSAEIKRYSYSWLRDFKKEIVFCSSASTEEYIDFKISSYEVDKYDEKKFLKIAFLKELKNKPEWMASL